MKNLFSLDFYGNHKYSPTGNQNLRGDKNTLTKLIDKSTAVQKGKHNSIKILIRKIVFSFCIIRQVNHKDL